MLCDSIVCNLKQDLHRDRCLLATRSDAVQIKFRKPSNIELKLQQSITGEKQRASGLKLWHTLRGGGMNNYNRL